MEIHVLKNEYVESGFALVYRKLLPNSQCLQLAFSEEQCGVDVRDVDLELTLSPVLLSLPKSKHAFQSNSVVWKLKPKFNHS